MSTKDTGGPAFPFTEANGANSGDTGMNIRDYFIAHAPGQPQPWFKPDMPPRPVATVWVSDDGLRKYSHEPAARQKEGEDYSAQNWAEIVAWHDDHNKQQLVQWPAAWADEQIKARSK